MATQAELFPITSRAIDLAPEERERIEADIQAHLDAVEAAIARLDGAEADADFEDNGDFEPDNDTEPDLGWPEMPNQVRAIKACMNVGARYDLEQDRADDEPSLGSPLATMHDQRYWASGSPLDLEQECEDEGACETVMVCE